MRAADEGAVHAAADRAVGVDVMSRLRGVTRGVLWPAVQAGTDATLGCRAVSIFRMSQLRYMPAAGVSDTKHTVERWRRVS